MNQVQTGFKVTIEIECETEQEIFHHMSQIRKEMKKHFGPKKPIPDGVDLFWEDNNCYGTHEVKVEPNFE